MGVFRDSRRLSSLVTMVQTMPVALWHCGSQDPQRVTITLMFPQAISQKRLEGYRLHVERAREYTETLQVTLRHMPQGDHAWHPITPEQERQLANCTRHLKVERLLEVIL